MDSATSREIRALVLAGTALLVIVFLGLLALQIRQVLAVLFLGIVVGVALNPIVDACARLRIPRVAAVLLVYLGIALAFTAFLYFAAREVTSTSLQQEIQELRDDYTELQRGTALPTVDQVEETITSVASEGAGGLVSQAVTVAGGIFSIFTLLFTALLFSITQDRMREVSLGFVSPAKRDNVASVLDKLAIGLRGFIRAEVIAMFSIGLVTYIGLLALGIKLPLLLAFIAFLLEVLPLIGPWLAYFPALAVAATEGLWAMVLVSLLYLGIQAFENYVVTPVVHSRESEMPALLVFTALLIGGALMGVIGALVALPVAVILRILFIEVVVPWNERRLSKPELVPADDAALEAEEPATTV